MKNFLSLNGFFLLLSTLSIAISTFAQEKEYVLKTDIPYYNSSINQSDEYIRERCLLDIYYPTSKKNFATMVYFHGGALSSGSKSIPQALMEKGYCIVAPNYRLSPKVKAPKYIEDAAAAVAWVFNNIKEFGGDPSKIFVSGFSAGGYLALMVGLDKRWLKANNIDANSLAGIIGLSGQTNTHSTIRKERGIAEEQVLVDDLAPLYHNRPDAPPLLLITGDRDLESPRRYYDQNAYLAGLMKANGHKQTKIFEMQGYGHNSAPGFPLLLESVKSILNGTY